MTPKVWCFICGEKVPYLEIRHVYFKCQNGEIAFGEPTPQHCENCGGGIVVINELE